MKAVFTFAIFILVANSAWAGFLELGVSGSYRRSNIADNAFDESQSLTGSLSYYFDEMSALELSYTDGFSKRYIGSSTGNDHITNLYYELLGMDFVYTFGAQDAILRPYVKVGVAYILKKKLVDQFQGFQASVVEDPSAAVPSAGFGFKFLFTKTLSLKFGLDSWTSRSIDSKPMQIDYAGRIGVSWLF